MINVVKLRDNMSKILISIGIIVVLITICIIFFKKYKIVPVDYKVEVVKEVVPKVVEDAKPVEKITTKQDVKVNIDVEKIIERAKPNVYHITINSNNQSVSPKKKEDANLKTAIDTISELDSLYRDIK